MSDPTLDNSNRDSVTNHKRMSLMDLGALTLGKFAISANWTNSANTPPVESNPWACLVSTGTATDGSETESLKPQPTNVETPTTDDASKQKETLAVVDAVDSVNAETVSADADQQAAQATKSEVNKKEAEKAQLAAEAKLAEENAIKAAEVAKAEEDAAAAKAKTEAVAKTQADAAAKSAAEAKAFEDASAEQAKAEQAKAQERVESEAAARLQAEKDQAATREKTAEAERVAAEQARIADAERNEAKIAADAKAAKEKALRAEQDAIIANQTRERAIEREQAELPCEPLPATHSPAAQTPVTQKSGATDYRTQPSAAAGSSVRSRPSRAPMARAITPHSQQAPDAYLQQLEQLVLQLNLELAMPAGNDYADTPEDQIQALTQRLINLSIENLELRRRLASECVA